MRQGVVMMIFFSVGYSGKRRYAKSSSKISAPELAFLANDRLKRCSQAKCFLHQREVVTFDVPLRLAAVVHYSGGHSWPRRREIR